MNVVAVKTAGRYLGAWGAIVLCVILLSLLFTFLGTITSAALVGMLKPTIEEHVLGQAEVRTIFKASKLGTIAGCMVTHGTITRNAMVRVLRNDVVVHDGKMGSLKRFAEDAREVAEGFECGILLDGFNDVKEGDVLEAYETREVAREA